MPFQFKIQLREISKPPVWRRLIVPENITFDQFHEIIQIAFDWRNCHLYRFSEQAWRSEVSYCIPDPEFNDTADMDSRKVKLSKVLMTPGQPFIYLYDFGDDWIHQIVLEDITDEKIMFPVCTGGKGACPPEDCGGPWGYENMKEVLADSSHPEHRAIRKWLNLRKDEQWDVSYINIPEINSRLKAI